MLTKVDVRGAGGELPSIVAGLRPVPERAIVEEIIADVRERGDQALIELTAKYDGCDLSSTGIVVGSAEIEAAAERVPTSVYQALEEAGGRIRAYQEQIMESIPERTVFERSGAYVESLRKTVAAAGLYAPGGRHSYPSTVLMSVIPAKVAGVEVTRLCVPPGDGGAIADASLAAAGLAGADEVLRIGGAQAIAALAYGTESVGRVDVIAGPGNSFVAEAKRQVFGDVGIDSIAGPSELMVIADNRANPAWIGTDLLAQAEHGPGGACVLVVWDESVAAQVDAALGEVEGSSVICDGPEQAVEIANLFAPEHLQLMVDDPGTFLDGVNNAGAVFLGYDTPTAYGDYIAGPNHILPTGGSARFSSALSVEVFLRRMHAVEFTQFGVETVGQVAEVIAEAEGMSAHAESVRLRTRAAEARE
ncbi:MAG: histidinol dehydrogenase [Acidobacteria bacterium]|nr:MAG: histidinol dehydrogenase [Acidobacteriota bacterium]